MTGKADVKNRLYQWKYVFAIITIVAVLSYQTGTSFATVPSTNTATITKNALVKECNYLIFTDGTTTTAQSCNTGAVLSSGTNAATVIQAALSGVSATSGGIVHVREGSYSISATLLVGNNTILEGEGWGTILALANSANVDLVRNSGWGSVLNEGIVIRDLTLDGNKSNQGVSTVDVISFNKSLRFEIDHTKVINGARFGIRWTGNGVGLVEGNKINGNASTGISVASSGDDSHIIGNDIGSNGGAGINLNGVANVAVIGNNVYLNTLQGIDVTTGPRNQIVGNNVHDNTQTGIRINASGTTDSADSNTVTGNTVRNNNTGNNSAFAEILMTGSAGINLKGVVISANTVTVTGASNTGIKESGSAVNYNVITSNSVAVTSGTAITVVGANTVNANNSTF